MSLVRRRSSPNRRSKRLVLWRYAQAGDLPGGNDAIDAELLWQLVRANRGKRVIAFTHKPVLSEMLQLRLRTGQIIASSQCDRLHDQLVGQQTPPRRMRWLT